MTTNPVTTFNLNHTTPILTDLPPEARDWLTSLPWQQRRYVLSLCHLVCATPSAQQAEFLDAYTAEGLLSHIGDDADMRQRVNEHLSRFRSEAAIDDETVRKYIRQMYVHSVQDARERTDLYIETALMMMGNVQDHSSVLSYILGFEILKLLFSMSWEQHERLYHLQPNQDDFTREYIHPVQASHKRHGIVKPKDRENFFARREYFVKTPNIHPKRMVNLIIEAFSADKIIALGFSILRHPNAIHYDHDYIYSDAESPMEGDIERMKAPRSSVKTVERTVDPKAVKAKPTEEKPLEKQSLVEQSAKGESSKGQLLKEKAKKEQLQKEQPEDLATDLFDQLFDGG
ncbi:MAG: cobyrinic acid a,c-diamide synthase [Cyanobacteria bacterium P01_D01_bin.105]